MKEKLISIKRQRIIALDLLRGFFLLVILADHLAWTPSLLLQFSTAYTGMFASAAEGFFVISGILVGYIYGPKILKHTKQSTFYMWRRSLFLYALAVGLTLTYAIWGHLLQSEHPRIITGLPNNLGDLVSIFTLTSSYGWADFLGRYAVFMFIAPLAIWMIAKGKSWVVILTSILTWAAFRETAPILLFAAWQIIFFVGMVIGYYLPRIESYLESSKTAMRLLKIITISGVFVYVTLFILFAFVPLILSTSLQLSISVSHLFETIYNTRADLLPYFDKTTMSLPRLLLGTLLFVTLYTIFRRFETKINDKTKGSLMLIGKYSLFVYCIQSFLLFLMDSIFTPPLTERPSWVLINTLIGVLSVALVYVATYLYDLYTTKKKVKI